MISATIEQVLCLPKGEGGMPVIVCPHCSTGSDFDLVRTYPKTGFSNVYCHIGFCRLCGGRVWFETDQANNVLTTTPTLIEKAPEGLPKGHIGDAFLEAARCIAANAPNGSLVMSRRAIDEAADYIIAEAVKKDPSLAKPPKPRDDIPTKLDWLALHHLITPPLHAWASQAQIGGKIGAHGTGGDKWGDIDLHWATKEDAESVLDFARSFFDYAFTMPARLAARMTSHVPASQSGTGSNTP